MAGPLEPVSREGWTPNLPSGRANCCHHRERMGTWCKVQSRTGQSRCSLRQHQVPTAGEPSAKVIAALTGGSRVTRTCANVH
jgi:hypothetical protein